MTTPDTTQHIDSGLDSIFRESSHGLSRGFQSSAQAAFSLIRLNAIRREAARRAEEANAREQVRLLAAEDREMMAAARATWEPLLDQDAWARADVETKARVAELTAGFAQDSEEARQALDTFSARIEQEFGVDVKQLIAEEIRGRGMSERRQDELLRGEFQVSDDELTAARGVVERAAQERERQERAAQVILTQVAPDWMRETARETHDGAQVLTERGRTDLRDLAENGSITRNVGPEGEHRTVTVGSGDETPSLRAAKDSTRLQAELDGGELAPELVEQQREAMHRTIAGLSSPEQWRELDPDARLAAASLAHAWAGHDEDAKRAASAFSDRLILDGEADFDADLAAWREGGVHHALSVLREPEVTTTDQVAIARDVIERGEQERQDRTSAAYGAMATKSPAWYRETVGRAAAGAETQEDGQWPQRITDDMRELTRSGSISTETMHARWYQANRELASDQGTIPDELTEAAPTAEQAAQYWDATADKRFEATSDYDFDHAVRQLNEEVAASGDLDLDDARASMWAYPSPETQEETTMERTDAEATVRNADERAARLREQEERFEDAHETIVDAHGGEHTEAASSSDQAREETADHLASTEAEGDSARSRQVEDRREGERPTMDADTREGLEGVRQSYAGSREQALGAARKSRGTAPLNAPEAARPRELGRER